MRKSDIPREEIFFTTKILTRVMTYESAKAQIQRTFMNSGLGYLDLLLVHAPFGGPEGRKGAWRAIVEAQEAGITRSIGVSNYGVHHLDELEAYIKELEKERGPGRGGVIDVGQWELHPWMPRPDIQEWCKRRGIMLQAYSPVTQGKRLDDPLLKPLVQKHGKTAAQILLRWSLQMGFSPLPKSANPTRIQENSDVYDFELDEEDMKCLDTGVYESCTWDPTLISLSE
jgi:diketogulonate reductase-like aldo/keto reductase